MDAICMTVRWLTRAMIEIPSPDTRNRIMPINPPKMISCSQDGLFPMLRWVCMCRAFCFWLNNLSLRSESCANLSKTALFQADGQQEWIICDFSLIIKDGHPDRKYSTAGFSLIARTHGGCE